MKKILKNYIYIIMSVIMLIAISCASTEEPAPEPAPAPAPQPTPEPKPVVKTEIIKGELTLYTVTNAHDIVKKKDYEVSNELDLAYQQNTQAHNEIWELGKKIIVSEYEDYLKEFLIFSGDALAANVLAYSSEGFVAPITDDLKEWRLAMAINAAYKNGVFNPNKLTQYTLIHELGHIIALNDTQIDTNKAQAECRTYYADEGCVRDLAYLQAFYQEFWDNIMSEWNADNYKQFYGANKDQFVSEYAASNTTEDFAESFAHFVTEDLPTPNQLVTKNLIKDKKVNFFAKSSKFINLRTTIRRNLNISETPKFTKGDILYK